VADAGVGSGDRVLEIGAGLGSLTVALAGAGAQVRAIEFDRKLMPALEEVTAGMTGVTLRHADAAKLDWATELPDAPGEGADSRPWIMCSNLPYNIAVPLVLTMLEDAPGVGRFVVMVQREVGERLASGPGDEAYGAVSVRVAYRAHATVIRRVPPTVFWPRPKVASVVVKIDRRAEMAVDVDPERLWQVVDAGFAERRKTMRNALRRLGLSLDEAREALAASRVAPNARAEELSLETFATIAERMHV
jgi:16S rRNA (adenine1518-N6/adenine1519-N6)-dimethyltransferase